MHLSSPVCPRLVLLLLGVEHVLPGLHRAGVQAELLVAGGRDHVGVGVAVTDGGARLLLGVGASAIDNVANTPILALAMSHVIEKNQDNQESELKKVLFKNNKIDFWDIFNLFL